MIPPISKKNTVSVHRKNYDKQASGKKQLPTPNEPCTIPLDVSISYKGKIRKVVYQTLRRKFGDRLSQEAQFIEMVNWVSKKLESNVSNPEQVEAIIDSLLNKKK
ncbi:hypothetical protein [Pseudoalteromonas aurantia]|uniref:Uncharacterized protein n=1 Tax=Pseudoalteromonas aurantia TaxID=43654 RepID=A0A5S3V705_9GAMM|nr:hypothetical protein [Pseudoalteromonas aurantia]TMO66614.1 hypothetical protein CWC19_15730 [Pseudoalteromonas aurantia]